VKSADKRATDEHRLTRIWFSAFGFQCSACSSPFLAEH
jgi:hypothetical protein